MHLPIMLCKSKTFFTSNNLNSFQQQLYEFDQDKSYLYPKERREKKGRKKKKIERPTVKRLSELRNKVANSLFVFSKMY